MDEDETAGAASTANPDAADDPDAPDAVTASTPRHRWASWISIVVVSMVVAIGLRVFVVQTFFVPSGSMIPTLMPYDRILVQKIGYSVTEGAIIVLQDTSRAPAR